MPQRGRLPLRWVLVGMLGLSLLTALGGRGLAATFRQGFRILLLGPSDVGTYLATAFSERWKTVGQGEQTSEALREAKDREDFLRQQVANLQLLLDEADAQLVDLHRLNRLFVPTAGEDYELIPAHVVAGESLPYSSRLMLSRGRNSGFQAGDPVMTRRRLATDRQKTMPKLYVLAQNALVGQLGKTWSYGAELILVTDEGFVAEVAILRDITIDRTFEGPTGQERLTDSNNRPIYTEGAGDGRSHLMIEGVPASQSVRAGDFVHTLPHGNYIPLGIPIGKVDRVWDDADEPGSQIVRVKPDADLERARRVYVFYPLGRRGSESE